MKRGETQLFKAQQMNGDYKYNQLMKTITLINWNSISSNVSLVPGWCHSQHAIFSLQHHRGKPN